MKLLTLACASLFLVILDIPLTTAFAQGSLTPPGAPAPTMKTLAQIEARTPISGAITINQPGSYYLTTNISVSSGNAILITANNVTLDLNGFTISSTATPPSGYAIAFNIGQVTNITVLNGFVSGNITNNGTTYGGSGFQFGVYGAGYNSRIKNVSVSGCLYDGIHVRNDSSTAVEFCSVSGVGSLGIGAQSVSDCTAVNCGNTGILAVTAHNCYGQSYGTGIFANSAQNCYGYSIGTGDGIDATTANNCYGYASGSGIGLSAGSGVAIGCFGQSASGVGIYARIGNSCIIGGGSTNITFKYNMP